MVRLILIAIKLTKSGLLRFPTCQKPNLNQSSYQMISKKTILTSYFQPSLKQLTRLTRLSFCLFIADETVYHFHIWILDLSTHSSIPHVFTLIPTNSHVLPDSELNYLGKFSLRYRLLDAPRIPLNLNAVVSLSDSH